MSKAELEQRISALMDDYSVGDVLFVMGQIAYDNVRYFEQGILPDGRMVDTPPDVPKELIQLWRKTVKIIENAQQKVVRAYGLKFHL